MTLPASGYIGLAHVNQELGRPLNQHITMNDPDVRRLAGAPSGAVWMSFLHGKSNVIREPGSGEYSEYPNMGWILLPPNLRLRWWSVDIATVPATTTSHTSGVWTYFRGTQAVAGSTTYFGAWRQRLGP